ncbi:PilC/PilY family type IV pilus protein [Luteimonas sp. gir]|uniref:PilC/PilY family type IV pilus protein n=1 Tax=Luteimonas sp. gir TaxID=3127960 RepID=UPI003075E50C
MKAVIKSRQGRRDTHLGSHRKWWVMPIACAMALLVSTANASFPIPDDPLTTASRIAPNILFILDDSGSMAFDYMPDDAPTGWRRQSYSHNSIYYNPANIYRPWTKADGELMANAEYTSVSTHADLLTGSTNLSSSNQEFYVPIAAGAVSNNQSDYYRYTILTNGTVERAEYGSVQESRSQNVSGYPLTGRSASTGNWLRYSFSVPSDAVRLTISISGGKGDADLYVRRVSAPSLYSYQCRPYSSGNSETCEFTTNLTGTYHVGIYADSGYSDVTLSITYAVSNRCGSGTGSNDWVNCQLVTPTGRTDEQERQNFANWYHYHRTRMKAAKAGASAAFAGLDGGAVRVGYQTIQNRSNFLIPVNDGNDGRFVDTPGGRGVAATTSRSTWYSRLFAATSDGGTPLRRALDQAGKYFERTDASGPYGPLSGEDQLAYACRQNFSILTTDGFWNDLNSSVMSSNALPGYKFTAPENSDNSDGTTITGPRGQSYTYKAGRPYSDGQGNTLADVAMYYWKRDLRPDMSNVVPSSPANPAFWQHMVTFGVSIGAKGVLDPRSDLPKLVSGAVSWPSIVPSDTSGGASVPGRIDDLWHAAVNSRGQFYQVNNTSEFVKGLGAALATITQRTSSYSNVATNSVSLDAGTKVFNASYVSGIWTGSVSARSVTTSGIPTDELWTASVPEFKTRSQKVFTFDGRAGASFPTTAQVAALARPNDVTYPVTGEANADYIKGDTRLEERGGAGSLRNRTSLLGDIVGSSPAYLKNARGEFVFVGANDGMLHAFDASNGVEVFAYVPGLVDLSKLASISRPDYAHRFFVDGPVVVSAESLTPKKNILVGTLGKGGKGVFSLDVTRADEFATTHVKWELAETPGKNMGLVMGRPVLGRVQGGGAAVIISNGVNSENNRAVLVVLNLETGKVIKEIDTGAGSKDQPNGLSTPTAVFGPDGRTIAYVYAGDMLGNVWKFDLSDESATSWASTKLFTALDAKGKPQPITGGLALATSPRTFDRWIFFGTGRFLTASDADPSNATPQSMYGFVEPAKAPWTRDDLVARKITVTGEQNGTQVRGFQARPNNRESIKGWYIDLPGAGERIVQDSQVTSGYLVTASMMPTGSVCEAGGAGYINALDAFTGTSAGSSYFDLDGDGSTSDEIVGGVPIGSISPGIGMPTLPNLVRGRLVVGGSGGGDVSSTPTIRPRWERVSWREIRRD